MRVFGSRTVGQKVRNCRRSQRPQYSHELTRKHGPIGADRIFTHRPAPLDRVILIPSQTRSSRRLYNGNCSHCDDCGPAGFALGGLADASSSSLHRLGGLTYASPS